MLLRGIAAIWAATVSRAPPSPTVVHVNAILGTSGQTIRQQSRTSSVIGLIFLTATLAAHYRTGVAWGAEQTTHVQDHPLQLKTKSLGHGGSNQFTRRTPEGKTLISSESIQQACSWPIEMAIFPFKL